MSDRKGRALAASLAGIIAPLVPVLADPSFPALYDVTGVAQDDVLNVRAEPDAGADVVATLAPGEKNIEVLGLSEDEEWARVGRPEATGWSAARFLEAQPPRPEDRLPVPMRCFGTEPFWAISLPGDGTGAYQRLPNPLQPLRTLWEGRPSGSSGPDIGAKLDNQGEEATLLTRREYCDDGMSDREYGISARLFLGQAEKTVLLAGCCSLSGH